MIQTRLGTYMYFNYGYWLLPAVGIDVQEVYSPRYSGPPALKGPQASKEGAGRVSSKPCAHRCINKNVYPFVRVHPLKVKNEHGHLLLP